MLNIIVKFIAAIGALVLSSLSPQQSLQRECSSYGNVSYCYYPGSKNSQKIVYFFHGFANDSKAWSWNVVTTGIENRWQQRSIERPHVVSISLGNFWLYNSSTGEQLNAFTHWFEKRFPQNMKRILYGDSMGGHNALRWALDYPDAFSRLALICPALPSSLLDLTPAKLSGLWPINNFANLVFADFYSGAEKKYNPIQNLTHSKNTVFKQDVYIAISRQDEFGFYEGDQKIFELFNARASANTHLDIQAVRHCKIQAQGLADFLSE